MKLFDSAINKKFADEYLCRCYEIKFKGKDFLLIGDMENGGAIATKEQYENYRMSTAYLCRDGKIRRFNIVIGSKDDIEIIKKKD